AIRVLPRLDDGLFRRAVDLAAGVEIALRFRQNLLVTASGLDASFHSCHCCLLVRATTAAPLKPLRGPQSPGGEAGLFRLGLRLRGALGLRDVALRELPRRDAGVRHELHDAID